MANELNSKFGKVAVLLGGESAEREISLLSGQAVIEGLTAMGLDVVAFDPKEQPLTNLKAMKIDRVWNALHGRGGEDGRVQAVLETLNIAYTGSGILGCAIAMDKWRSKMIWKAMGLPVAAHVLVKSDMAINEANLRNLIAKLGPVVFVKPSHEGSSVGMSKVQSVEELGKAIALARQYDDEVLVESFIQGREYTVSILNGRALPSISMVTPRDFYDYEAKYRSSDTEYHCPSGLDSDAENQIGELALNAFDALGCSGWGRVDFILDEHSGRFILLEANTVPGMTQSSLVPKAAKQIGISFNELTLEILKTSL